MTKRHPVDSALAARMRDSAFRRAYDVWLLVLTQQAAEIDLARRGMRHQRPPRSRPRRGRSPHNPVPRTA